MQIKPLAGSLGAEIIGADVRNADTQGEIEAAFADHSVLVFRDQNLSPEDHRAFAKRFGNININRFFKPVDGHPDIALVFKDKDHKRAIGEGWHTDHSYDTEPALGSILCAHEVPPIGGDTLFVSMSKAFEGLSEPIQKLISGLSAWHSSRHNFGNNTKDSEAAKTGRLLNQDAAQQDALHPMVIRHPLSGRPCLYVNPTFTLRIEGLNEDESRAILDMLYTHCQKPEFQCRVRWNAGDVTMWDNRATWHKAVNDYHGHRRLMHRITVEGCALEAAF